MGRTDGGYASLTSVCIGDALQGFRSHAIANPVGFDGEGVVVTQADAMERVPPKISGSNSYQLHLGDC